MLSLNKKFGSIILGVILMLGVASLAYAFSFTPDIIAFDGADAANEPACAAGNGQNGWDIDQVGLKYDAGSDTLTVGISMHNGIKAGDADGDGDPDTTAACMSLKGGTDNASLSGTEAIDFVFDANNDGQFDTSDYVAGVAKNTSTFAVAPWAYAVSPQVLDAGVGFGTAIAPTPGSVINLPSLTNSNPDFEFTITGFCTLMGKQPDCQDMLDFDFWVRAGSVEDAGTGEDKVFENFVPTAVTLSSFAARSSAGGPAGGLWLGLAGLTVLASGGLFWAKRRAS